jgi:uncharacterized surface protein with fasciclin (FAS1) repeats
MIPLALTLLVQHSQVYAFKTIVNVLKQDTRFETLVGHIQRLELESFLNDMKTATLFAPDNEAFAHYEGPTTRNTILYHLVPWNISADKFRHHQILESSLHLDHYLQNNKGQRLLIHRTDDVSTSGASLLAPIFVNDAQVTDTDILVNMETIIHVVNKVLEPPSLIGKERQCRDMTMLLILLSASTLESSDPNLYHLMDKVDLAQLMNQHRPFTMFYSHQSILQSFNDVERSYLESEYGANDMRHILHYLIVPGDFYAKDFVDEKQCKILSSVVKCITDMISRR